MQQDQQNDRAFNDEVEKLLQRDPDRFTRKEIDGIELIHDNDRVLVPMAARERLINWYHMILVHPGIDKQLNTMKSVFTWPKMKNDIAHHIKYCHQCQMGKRTSKKKYGLLPEKLAETTKWQRLNVDQWGTKKN